VSVCDVSRYQPKDFIETQEGLIFAVVTEDLEDRRILCSLRYLRTEKGFEKFGTLQANRLLAQQYPQYLYYSRLRDVELHGVDCEAVAYHHRPQQRLQELCNQRSDEPIENKLRQLISLFEANGLQCDQIGVTGSLLIGAQKNSSDIDLVFYQPSQFHKARRVIKDLLAKKLLQPLDESLWLDAYQRRSCDLSYDEYRWHEQRKYNKAAIAQTKFDISLLTPDRWQDLMRYRKQGRVYLKTTIDNDRHSFDYPARYKLNHPSVSEVVSYTATYAGQAVNGEQVEIQGQLEVSIAGHLRIVVGTDREATHEYIKAIPETIRN
jgi:predicted nucleotidyltransferase